MKTVEYEVKKYRGKKFLIIKPTIQARLFKKEFIVPLKWVLEND